MTVHVEAARKRKSAVCREDHEINMRKRSAEQRFFLMITIVYKSKYDKI